MNTDVTTSTLPWAKLLYSPVRAGNFQQNPLECLPSETVMESYVRQWYRFTFEGKHYALRPASDQVNPYNHLWPKPLPVDDEVIQQLPGFVIGYWHPGGAPVEAKKTSEQQALMEWLVEDNTLDVVPMTIFQRESQWVEPAIFVRGVTEAKARDIAQELGQRALVMVNPKATKAMLVDGYFPLGGYEWNLHQLPVAPCPLSLGYEVEVKPKREGGPWVSRSMLVAALWQHHRDLTHALTSCDVCSSPDGNAPKGRAIPLGRVIPASRYKYSYVAGFDDDAVPGLAWNPPVIDTPALPS